jgi:hypothetical protein
VKTISGCVVLAGALLSGIPATAKAAATTYAFDTVTAVELGTTNHKIVGIEKGTGVMLTAAWIDQVSESYSFAVSRCVPLVLTALEKPGRYYLYVTIDPADINIQIRSCRLELK